MHFLPLVLFLVTAVVQVHEALKNKAVIVGETTQMICTQNSEVTVVWFHTSPKDKIEQILFDGTKILLTSFSNTNATGRMRGQILKINPVQLENSGVFKCVVDSTEHPFQLIVLESKPVCGSSLNAVRQGFVDLWCQVNYTGFWPPRMQWMKGDRNIESKEHRLPTSLSTTLTVEAESVGSNASYSCKLYFTAEDNTLKDESQIVRNVPNFTFTFNAGDVYNSATQNTSQIHKASTQPQPISNGILWILTSCAALACVVVFVVIIYYLTKHPCGTFKISRACRKSAEPDLVHNAEVILNGVNPIAEIRVDVQPPELAQGFVVDEPEEMLDQNRVYAEVVIVDRLPLHMQDSPAWNNLHNRSIQPSPAWSHSSKNLPPSRSATPRNGSPFQTVNAEDIKYLDINSVASIPVPQSQQPRRPPARLPTFQAVSYASIDHTARPPPPLPPSDD